jgi:hypothetical protein
VFLSIPNCAGGNTSVDNNARHDGGDGSSFISPDGETFLDALKGSGIKNNTHTPAVCLLWICIIIFKWVFFLGNPLPGYGEVNSRQKSVVKSVCPYLEGTWHLEFTACLAVT